jgi:hypothetical protein
MGHSMTTIVYSVKYYIASQEIDSLSTIGGYWGQPQLTWYLLISQIQFNSC